MFGRVSGAILIRPAVSYATRTVMSGLSTGCSGACGPVMMDERRMTWFGQDRRMASSDAGSAQHVGLTVSIQSVHIRGTFVQNIMLRQVSRKRTL